MLELEGLITEVALELPQLGTGVVAEHVPLQAVDIVEQLGAYLAVEENLQVTAVVMVVLDAAAAAAAVRRRRRRCGRVCLSRGRDWTRRRVFGFNCRAVR